MDLQKVLSQVILFLLFLYLSPLGVLSRPLSSPSQSPEQFKMQALLREKADDRAQGQLLKDRAPRSILGYQGHPQRHGNSKKMPNSACFGQKIDRIGSISRLGCNVLK